MRILFFIIVFVVSMAVEAQNLDIDVLKYTIKIDTIDFKNKTLVGETIVDFKLKKKNLSYVQFSLLNYKITKLLFNNKEIDYQYDKKNILFPINQKYTLNDTFHLSVKYSGKPTQDKTWGGFFIKKNTAFNYGVGMSAIPPTFGRAWFVANDNFTDHALYRFEINCPKNMLAAANGSLVQKLEKENEHTFIWELHDSIPTYLASVGIGEYDLFSDIYSGEKKNIPIQIFITKGQGDKVPQIFRNLKPCLATFENLFGDYVWERVGYVSTPFPDGAMEHATNIAYGNQCNVKDCESTLYHELSHHWFGDLVTCASAKDMWLNEAWASYSEYLFFEKIYGFERAQKHLARICATELRYAPMSDGGYIALNNPSPQNTYGTNIYKKGAMTVHILRKTMGDSLFFATIKAYLSHFKFQNVSIEQFKEFWEKYSGLDLNPYFNMWIYSTGFPDFYISQTKISKKDKKYIVDLSIRQNLVQRENYLSGQNLECLIANREYSKIIKIKNRAALTNLTKEVNFKPELIVLDPKNKVLDAQFTFHRILRNTAIQNIQYSSLRVAALNLKDSIDFYACFHYSMPENTGGVEIMPFFWEINSLKDSTDIFQVGFGALNAGSYPFLFYRKDDSFPWTRVLVEKKEKGYYFVSNPENGQYIFGK